jgi:multidrug transporter EmrE-like cation transporter
VIGWLALLASLAATVGAQLYFKSYHLGRQRSHLLMAVVLFTAAVPCTMLAVRDFGIGRVYIATALSYVLAPAAAVYLFHERINRAQACALALIVAGVVTYNLH